MAIFEVDDIVKIVDEGKIYSTYPSFFEEQNCKELMKGYTYLSSPEREECNMTLFCVLAVGEHHVPGMGTICIINNGIHTYMIGEDGLSKAKIVLEEKDERIKVGDSVVISDIGKVYSGYDSFLLTFKDKLITKNFWNWKYGFSPVAPKTDSFKVEVVHEHLERPEEGNLAIITNMDNTFIVHVNGLEKI